MLGLRWGLFIFVCAFCSNIVSMAIGWHLRNARNTCFWRSRYKIVVVTFGARVGCVRLPSQVAPFLTRLVNRQLNDKERVAAALENANLLKVVNTCIAHTDWRSSYCNAEAKLYCFAPNTLLFKERKSNEPLILLWLCRSRWVSCGCWR